MIKIKYGCLIFLCGLMIPVPGFSAEAGKPVVSPAGPSAPDREALDQLKSVLEKYGNRNIQLKVEKTFRVPVIDRVSREKGNLYLEKGGRFRYFMSTDSTSHLLLFDGQDLWFQPDTGEKTVFKLSSHQLWRLFSGLFDPQRFFEIFLTEKMEKTPAGYVFYLKPRRDMPDIQKIILTAGRHIKKIQVLWKDVDSRQEYKFSNPWVKKYFPESLFVFDTKGFKVISQVPGKGKSGDTLQGTGKLGTR